MLDASRTDPDGDLVDTQADGPGVELPYKPATNSPEFNALASKLEHPRIPDPIERSETDGEMSARYDASGLRPATRNRTPLPEPPVLLSCTEEGLLARELPTLRRIHLQGVGALNDTVDESFPPVSPSIQTEVRKRRTVWFLAGMAAAALLLFATVAIGVFARTNQAPMPRAGSPTFAAVPVASASNDVSPVASLVATPPAVEPPVASPPTAPARPRFKASAARAVSDVAAPPAKETPPLSPFVDHEGFQ